MVSGPSATTTPNTSTGSCLPGPTTSTAQTPPSNRANPSLSAFVQKSPSTAEASRPASILSGRSILSILNNAQADSAPDHDIIEEENLPENETIEIDDSVEEMLGQGCARFARELMEQRPRMGNIFQEAAVTGNQVSLKVPNESSYDELMHSLSEMKMRLAELSGLQVPIEFDVKIAADPKGLKPIKVEDRLRYLTQKNPLLTTLRQQLELDVE